MLTNTEDINRLTEDIIKKLRELQTVARSNKNSADSGLAVAQKVNHQAKVVQEVANRVGDTINVIEDISVQTSLLSLNASVEAARAGDAGKGFAVVAGAIRSIADQASQSSKNVRDSIQQLAEVTTNNQNSVQSVVWMIEKIQQDIVHSAELINTLTQLSNKQEHNLGDISGKISSIKSMFSEDVEMALLMKEVSNSSKDNLVNFSQALHSAQKTIGI